MFVFQPNERQPMCDQTVQLKSDLVQVRQESRELQERLMVSEATVQAQAEQLKDYRELLSKSSHLWNYWQKCLLTNNAVNATNAF